MSSSGLRPSMTTAENGTAVPGAHSTTSSGTGLDALPAEPREQLQRHCQQWLRGYSSIKTRTSYAERLGIPRHWIPGRSSPSGTRGRKPRGYTGHEWLLWCLHHGVPYLQPDRDDLNRWLDELAEAGYAQRSQATMLSAVSSFYRHLLREGLVNANPVERIDRNARALRPPKQSRARAPLSWEQTRALLEAAWLLSTRTRHGLRDRAMLEVLVTTGLRADELVELDRADYHRPSPGAPGQLTITGKGGHTRVTGLPVEVADAVDDYHAGLPTAGTVAPAGHAGGRVRQPLFATSTGGRLHTSHVTAVLKRVVDTLTPTTPPREHWKRELLRSAVGARLAAELAPIKGRVHPHRLRHSYGTHAINAGVPIRQVQRDLGHADVATTEAYVHDEHQAAHSAAHQLSPGLHRGWLTARNTRETAREAERAETPGQLSVDLPDRQHDTDPPEP